MALSWKVQIPAPAEGRVLSTTNIVIGNLLTLIPILGIFLGIGLCYPAALLLDAGAEVPPKDASPVLVQWKEQGAPVRLLGWVGLALGVVTMGYFVVQGIARISIHADRRYRRLMERAIARRSGAVVDPKDSRAVFVEVVPRENWSKTMMENAEEVGFLALDYTNKLLLFEGDCQRWRLPGDRIADLDVDVQMVGAGNGARLAYEFIRLHVREEDGSATEVLLRPRLGTGAFGLHRRLQRASVLMVKIDLLRPVEQQSILPKLRADGMPPEHEEEIRQVPLM